LFEPKLADIARIEIKTKHKAQDLKLSNLGFL